jgi:hypothetical protein
MSGEREHVEALAALARPGDSGSVDPVWPVYGECYESERRSPLYINTELYCTVHSPRPGITYCADFYYVQILVQIKLILQNADQLADQDVMPVWSGTRLSGSVQMRRWVCAGNASFWIRCGVRSARGATGVGPVGPSSWRMGRGYAFAGEG